MIGLALARLAALGIGPDQISVTMIGSGQDLTAARSAAGPLAPAVWIDWIAPEDLPTLTAGHHVALGIFGTTTKSGDVVPNKVYQAAAAGCAIVTSDTAPQRRMLGDRAEFVPAGAPDELADMLVALVSDRDRLARRRREARALAVASFSGAGLVPELIGHLPVSSPPPRPGPEVRRAVV